MNVCHEEAKIKLEKAPSLFSIRDRFEVNEWKKDEIPNGEGDTSVGDDNKSDR